MGAVPCIAAVPVTADNREAALALCVAPHQRDMIETVGECLREAEALALWRPVCLYQGDRLVGFAMYGFFPQSGEGRAWLDRLLIDWRHQGKGYGRQAMRLLLERIWREYHVDRVYLSVYQDNARAIGLYQSEGFGFNGEVDTKGEKVMIRIYPTKA